MKFQTLACSRSDGYHLTAAVAGATHSYDFHSHSPDLGCSAFDQATMAERNYLVRLSYSPQMIPILVYKFCITSEFGGYSPLPR